MHTCEKLVQYRFQTKSTRFTKILCELIEEEEDFYRKKMSKVYA